MGKATQKSSPVSLGTKRSCPDCGTKFYDFNKDGVVCPKCDTKIDKNDTAVARSEPKRSKKEIPEEALMESEDIVVDEASDDFESAEDLDEEDDLVEDIETDDGDDDY